MWIFGFRGKVCAFVTELKFPLIPLQVSAQKIGGNSFAGNTLIETQSLYFCPAHKSTTSGHPSSWAQMELGSHSKLQRPSTITDRPLTISCTTSSSTQPDTEPIPSSEASVHTTLIQIGACQLAAARGNIDLIQESGSTFGSKATIPGVSTTLRISA